MSQIRARLVEALGGEACLERAAQESRVVSVFVYGSQARGDQESSSDLEAGVLVGRSDGEGAARRFQAALRPLLGVRVYAFEGPRLSQGLPDVPFTRRIFVAELRDSAVTLFGPDIRNWLPVLPIRPGDLHEEHAFVRARILDGLICARDGHWSTAAALCWKASYMAGRLYLLATERKLITRRDILIQHPWPPELAGLVSWMNKDNCEKMIAQDPGNVRILSKLMTQPIYSVLDKPGAAFYVE